MHSSPVLTAALCGLVASVAWAFANVYIQRTSREAGPLAPLLWGQLFGGLLLATGLWWWPAVSLDVDPLWLTVGGAASALAYYNMFKAFEGGPVSTVGPIIAGWAFVSTVLGALLFGEVLSGPRWVGGLMVIGGVVGFVALSSNAPSSAEWHSSRSRVVAHALAAAVGFGVMVAAIQPLAQQLGPVASILALWGLQWVFLAPFVLRDGWRSLRVPRGATTSILIFGLLETIGFLAVDIGAAVGPVSVVAPCSSIGALLTVAIGSVWLGERVSKTRWLLSLVVVAGVAVLSMS